MSKKTEMSGTDAQTGPASDPKRQLADIIVRHAGKVMRNALEERSVIGKYDPSKARDQSDGRAIITSIALYGAHKVAARSSLGLALVAGGFVLKLLHDRGRDSQSGQQAGKTGRG